MEKEKVELKGEMIYLKKSFLGWKVIHPVRNEDQTFNWKNLIAGGSWWNLIFIVFIVLIILGLIFEYHNNLKLCAKIMSEINLNTPVNINLIGDETLKIPKGIINLTDLNLGGGVK